jgi:hypothetical protein
MILDLRNTRNIREKEKKKIKERNQRVFGLGKVYMHSRTIKGFYIYFSSFDVAGSRMAWGLHVILHAQYRRQNHY